MQSNYIVQKKEYIKEEEKCGLRREWEQIYKKVCFRLQEGDIKISNKQKAKDINPDEWLDKMQN